MRRRRSRSRKRAAVLAVILLVILISVVAGTVLFRQNPFKPKAPVYQLDIGYTGGSIGTLTISGDTYRNINSEWFNITLWGNEHYVIQFPYYVEYDGIVSTEAFVYLLYNVSAVFGPGTPGLSIQTIDSNSSLTYEQQVTLNRSDPALTGINANFSNVQFSYTNGTAVESWIQSIDGESATYWLKLSSEVNQTLAINVGAADQNLLSASGPVGEAPQLSSIYGQYDNGRLVFPVYYNFSSPSEAAGWSGQNYVIDNGLSWNTNSTTRFYIYGPPSIPVNNNTVATERAYSSFWGLDFTVSQVGASDWVGVNATGWATPRVYSGWGPQGAASSSYAVNMSSGYHILSEMTGNGTFFLNNSLWYSFANAGGLYSTNPELARWYYSTGTGYDYQGNVTYVYERTVQGGVDMPTAGIVTFATGDIYV